MFKEKIMKIIKLWTDRLIYDPKFLYGLEATFVKKLNIFGSSQASTKGSSSSSKDSEKTNFIKESSEIGIQLRFVEEKLNDNTTKELEKICRENGLSTSGERRDLIERILVLRDYELRSGKEGRSDIQFETVERTQIEITPELIRDYNKFLSVKQSQSLGLHEINKLISGGLELLTFIQTRNEKIEERDVNGVPLDDFDYALYDLPRDEDLDSTNIFKNFS